MILDTLTEFADAESVALAAGTHAIGAALPLSVARDVGNGQPVYLCITCDTEIITGGAAGTLQFQLVSDNSSTIAEDGSATVHMSTNEFVTDGTDANDPEMKAGAMIFCAPLPLEGNPYETYLGLLAIVATTTITAGAINAFLTLDPKGWKAYPEGDN